MIINKLVCPDDLDILNTELQDRNIKPDKIITIVVTEAPSGKGMGSVATSYQVFYWDNGDT